MKKMWIWFTAILFVLGLGAQAGAQLDSSALKALEDLQATMFPPKLVGNVTMNPAEPADGAEVTVTAELHNDADETEDETLEAAIMFSSDGGKKWEQADMESDDDKTWTGTIPGFPSGTNVLWYLKAVDSSGNYYVETPCMVTDPADKNGPFDDPCLVPASPDDDPADDEDSKMIKDLDIVGVKVGASKDYFYSQVDVEGKVSEGKVQPTYIHAYGGAISNPDIKGETIFDSGVAMIYAPLAKVANFDKCMLAVNDNGKPVTSSQGIQCFVSGNKLLFQVTRSAVKDNPSNWVNLVFVTAAVNSIQPIGGAPADNTHFTHLQIAQRSYTVK